MGTRTGVAILLALFAAGCSSIVEYNDAHTLVFGPDAAPKKPGQSRRVTVPAEPDTPHYRMNGRPGDLEEETTAEFKSHVAKIIAGIKSGAWPRNCPDAVAPASNDARRVLIFVHGGLKTTVQEMRRAERLLDETNAARQIQQCFYPIFIVWRSSLISSYWHRLTLVRQGRNRPPSARLTSAVAFLDDASRLPFGFLSSGTEMMLDGVPITGGETQMQLFQSVADSVQSTFKGQLRLGRDEQSTPERAFDVARRFPMFVVKPFTGSVIDSFGDPAAKIMLRRTELMFEPEACYMARAEKDYEEPCRDRSLTYFFRELANEAKRGNWELTMVGHSYGTIVVTKALRRVPELGLRNLVLMAAAVPLNEYQDTLFGGPDSDGSTGYLSRHKDTQVYHLVLHRLAERRENTWNMDIAPRGSLLVWLDAFINEPRHVLERTTGRTINLVPTLLDIPEQFQGRVHLKEFDYGRRNVCDPQTHGAFGDFMFWRKAFWSPTDDMRDPCTCRLSSHCPVTPDTPPPS